MVKKPHLVRVIWHDACSQGSWQDPDTFDRAPALATSYGWLISRDRRSVVLATTQFEDGICGQYLMIPAGCVKSVKRLRG